MSSRSPVGWLFCSRKRGQNMRFSTILTATWSTSIVASGSTPKCSSLSWNSCSIPDRNFTTFGINQVSRIYNVLHGGSSATRPVSGALIWSRLEAPPVEAARSAHELDGWRQFGSSTPAWTMFRSRICPGRSASSFTTVRTPAFSSIRHILVATRLCMTPGRSQTCSACETVLPGFEAAGLSLSTIARQSARSSKAVGSDPSSGKRELATAPRITRRSSSLRKRVGSRNLRQDHLNGPARLKHSRGGLADHVAPGGFCVPNVVGNVFCQVDRPTLNFPELETVDPALGFITGLLPTHACRKSGACASDRVGFVTAFFMAREISDTVSK
jgi:hypothetical protein